MEGYMGTLQEKGYTIPRHLNGLAGMQLNNIRSMPCPIPNIMSFLCTEVIYSGSQIRSCCFTLSNSFVYLIFKQRWYWCYPGCHRRSTAVPLCSSGVLDSTMFVGHHGHSAGLRRWREVLLQSQWYTFLYYFCIIVDLFEQLFNC